ncbi:MAG: hypothetical protein V3S87_01115 [Alphaproteobacteria bacterium]
MSDARAQAAAPTTTWPAGMERPNRRLSDKVRDAVQQALGDGRREIADRLTLVSQALAEEEGAWLLKRRREDLDRA